MKGNKRRDKVAIHCPDQPRSFPILPQEIPVPHD